MDSNESRAEFEKWAAQYPGNYNLEKFDGRITNAYKCSITQSTWAGWQAAEQRMWEKSINHLLAFSGGHYEYENTPQWPDNLVRMAELSTPPEGLYLNNFYGHTFLEPIILRQGDVYGLYLRRLYTSRIKI